MKRLRPCWDEESCANLLNVNLELEKDAGRRMKVAGFLWLLLVEALLPENDRKRKSVTINCGCSKEALVSGEEVIIDKNDVDCGLLKTCHCSLTEGKCSLTEEKCSLTEEKCSLTEGKCSLTEGKCSLTEENCSLTEGNCSLTEGNCSLTEDVNENSNQTARLNCAIKLRFYFFRICERKKEKKKDEIEEPFSPPDSSNIKKKKKKK
jgi:hypothetical protein